MILGQSAATGAVMAIDKDIDVQDVPYAELREQLLADGQIFKDPKEKLAAKLKGYVLDENDAKLVGHWSQGSMNSKHGSYYLHDNNKSKGSASAHFKAKLPKPGKYEVLVHYTENGNRASNVPVKLIANGETMSYKVNQKQGGDQGYRLGTFYLNEAELIISNEGTDGFVVIDAVQFLAVQ